MNVKPNNEIDVEEINNNKQNDMEVFHKESHLVNIKN
jgi:hypothetical protein